MEKDTQSQIAAGSFQLPIQGNLSVQVTMRTIERNRIFGIPVPSDQARTAQQLVVLESWPIVEQLASNQYRLLQHLGKFQWLGNVNCQEIHCLMIDPGTPEEALMRIRYYYQWVDPLADARIKPRDLIMQTYASPGLHLFLREWIGAKGSKLYPRHWKQILGYHGPSERTLLRILDEATAGTAPMALPKGQMTLSEAA